MATAPASPVPFPGKRNDFLPFHRPSVTEADILAVSDALRAGWLTHGPVCERFEGGFARATNSAFAVSLSSGTAAMHLALLALGVGPGDEVVTTPLTFCSTAHVIEHLGATPVFADVDSSTLQIDPLAIERVLTSRTRALLPVHYGGHPFDMDAILAIAEHRGLPVVEDAAHAFGAAIGGRPIGSFGRVTCFSFYATKNITTGEGGMATTDDREVADRLRSLRLHGISRDAWKRYRREGTWFYEVTEPGFKANLTDPQAALGLSQLARDPEMRARRTTIAERYSESFNRMGGVVEPPVVSDGVTSAWHLYVLRLQLDALRIDRAAFIEELDALGVGASVHFIPLHLQPHFQKAFGLAPGDFPNAEREYRRIVSLPIYPDMTDEDVDYVIRCVDHVISSHAR